jgi:putative endonuclease
MTSKHTPSEPNSGPKSTSKARGIRAEDEASAYLENLGWRILARNYRCAFGEIDIVAVEPSAADGVLAFIEVKARTSNRFGNPLSAITPAKQQKLAACAACFLADYPQGLHEPHCRFDAISAYIIPTTGKSELTLYRGVFTA